ncbi:phage tail tape measure protein [Pseudodesulfovibrio sp.]|uniref:phage tail tape measure protein n=1 Tax=unclassified Pseudodesulfovibrio TaxID=2661612 RepID=UPI003B00B221
MSTKLEKLTFSIGLLDRITHPIAKVQKHITGMADASQKAFAQIGTGAAGVAGSGLSLMALVNPAEQMRQALGDVDSLDVNQKTLKGLSDKALQYSIKYGRAADSFASSAYDIQSSIDGLHGNDLAEFTNVANVLAVGGKSDASTMTDYMGTMYGIFKDGANRMGKVNWVKQLAGQTATAIQIFKTTGSEMSAAFTSVGANAKSAGIDVVEQMAVMGKLQSTMSGSEAGTKYKSFLAGVGNAQKSLGLSFVDSQGHMLGMLDILGKIRGKFGDSLDVGESDALKKAFGSDEAVSLIKLLMADTDGLADSMEKLGKVKGMEKAMEMASKRVTPLQRVSQGIKGITIALGQGLGPVLDPIIDGMANASAIMTKWMAKYPNITKAIGFAILAVLGLTAAMGIMAIVGGLATMAFNPVILVIGLMAAGITALIVYWGKIKAAMMDTTWGRNILKALDFFLIPLRFVIWQVKLFITHWDALVDTFQNSYLGKGILLFLGHIGDAIGWLWDKAKGLLGILAQSLDWWDKATGMLPRIFSGKDEGNSTSSPSLEATKKPASIPGGMAKHIATTVANTNSNSRTIGKQENNFYSNMTRQELEESLWMEA